MDVKQEKLDSQEIPYSSDRPLADQVAERIKEYIIQGNLSSGDKLPTEMSFASQMGVARSTVREALRSLESQNVVRVKHGSGTFVAENTGVSSDPLGLSFIQNKQKLTRDLLEVRTIIEPAIAELAAVNATPEDIAEMEDLYNKMEYSIMHGEDYLDVDIRFHHKLAQASGNLVVPKLLPIITEAVDLFTNRTHYALLQETLDTHRAVLDAVKEHNVRAAREAMILHLAYNANALRNIERQELGLPAPTPKVPPEVLAMDHLKPSQSE